MLDPNVWRVPPYMRRFPDFVAEVYESEETPLVDLVELWLWKWDLADVHPVFGHQPNDTKMALRLGIEIEDFLRIEEESRAALDKLSLDSDLGASETHEEPEPES